MKIVKFLLFFVLFSPQIYAGLASSKLVSPASLALLQRMEVNNLTPEKFEELVNLGAVIDDEFFLESFKLAAWRGFDSVVDIVLDNYSKKYMKIPLHFLVKLMQDLEILIEKAGASEEIKRSQAAVLLNLRKHAELLRKAEFAQQLGLSTSISFAGR